MSSKRLRRLLVTAGCVLAAAPLALAQEEPGATSALAEAINEATLNLNTVWTCVAAFLIFFMQAGFAMVESGFTRAKNACNIMMKNLMDFSVGSIMWFLIGFGLMFGGGASGWFGWGYFAGQGDLLKVNDLGWTFWIFQCVFAGTAATIVSGSMAGRTKFVGYLAYSAVVLL